jgi:hypothetical protein
MGKEFNRSYSNLQSSTRKGYILDSNKRSNFIGLGSVSVSYASGTRLCCSREIDWKGKHTNIIHENLCRDNEG